MGVCNCSMFCCMLLFVHSSIAIILIGKRELVAFLNLSSGCLLMVERPFLTVPWGCLGFVIVVFPDHTHLLFLNQFYGAHLAPNSDVDQDTFWKVTKHNKHYSQEVSPFPAGDQKAAKNRHHSKTHTKHEA